MIVLKHIVVWGDGGEVYLSDEESRGYLAKAQRKSASSGQTEEVVTASQKAGIALLIPKKTFH